MTVHHSSCFTNHCVRTFEDIVFSICLYVWECYVGPERVNRQRKTVLALYVAIHLRG